MAIYRYQHGDRPLPGFTIQHGLGRGGFGEVYYALSDSGREVALKAVQNYEDIELRGIKHCMNLKHPQLVSIFDIKHSDEGLPFVVMEYIDGPSLRDILDSHPEGLGPAKAAFFLQEIAKGLAYLHECGVVHRDLKPHNVFYEQGVVKIGDYSLSKAISTSHRSGHTVTVGTVHYMAPEISLGRYDHTVDIYALGVLLYEMLKGHPPFLGDSMGEVLMKHVAGDVEVSELPQPFARVIKKALAKEPTDRYQSAQELIDDLMGHADLQQSVASLGPETLTVIAEKAMQARPATPPPPPQPEVAATAAKVAQHSPQAKQKKDPYRYTIDLRPGKGIRGEQMHAAAAALHAHRPRVFKGFFITALVLLAVALFATAAEVGHPGPLIPLVALVVGAMLWKHSKRNKAGRRSVYHAHQTSPPTADPTSQPRVDPAQSPLPETERHGDLSDINESPHSRLVALLMSCVVFFVPLAGLQRIYVGKVKSGLLWLFTLGLFGIGQLVDMIMIALGQFKDANGRRVLSFTKERVHAMTQPVNQYSAVVRRQWTESRIGFKLGNLVFNLIGAVLLLVSLGVGATVALDLPRAMAVGAFGYEVQHEIADGIGFHDWYIPVTAALGLIALTAGTLAAICLIFARRESNWTHMLRIPVAAVGFVGSVLCLGATTDFGSRWSGVAERIQSNLIGEAFRFLLVAGFWPGVIFGSLLFVTAIFVLAWPARRRVEQQVMEIPVREAAEPAVRKQTVGNVGGQR